MESTTSDFVKQTPEKFDLNQYWYSTHTLSTIVDEITNLYNEENKIRIAFLSTPSVYYSCPKYIQFNSKLFDIDTQWWDDPNFQYFDYNHPDNIPSCHKGKFNVCIIDPPFITEDAWSLYGQASKILMKQSDININNNNNNNINNKLILSSIPENINMLLRIFESDTLHEVLFKPSIPRLVYQYSFFCNYATTALSYSNKEILTQ
eukprot:GHVR01073762.1.p1 GENE.GHVR01073762.1~~GHVR01073762.1.p1  ORF type:complete len:205 (+),score=35.27 GHVR01073762.1:123-737(+)